MCLCVCSALLYYVPCVLSLCDVLILSLYHVFLYVMGKSFIRILHSKFPAQIATGQVITHRKSPNYLLCPAEPARVLHRRCFFTHCARNHCSGALGGHWRLEALRRCASKPFSARNHCSRRLLFLQRHSNTPQWRCFFEHCARNQCSGATGARNHCSGVLRSHSAREIAARA